MSAPAAALSARLRVLCDQEALLLGCARAAATPWLQRQHLAHALDLIELQQRLIVHELCAVNYEEAARRFQAARP